MRIYGIAQNRTEVAKSNQQYLSGTKSNDIAFMNSRGSFRKTVVRWLKKGFNHHAKMAQSYENQANRVENPELKQMYMNLSEKHAFKEGNIGFLLLKLALLKTKSQRSFG